MSVCVSGWVELAKPASVQKSFHAFRLWLLHISTQRSHHMYTVMYTSNTVNKQILFVLLLCITVVYKQHVYEGKSQNQKTLCNN